jgi:PadR family transcriptional regulator PadR
MSDVLQIGELEQLVLLSVLRLGEDAHGIEIRRTLRGDASRSVSRGALYKTLERLENKGLLSWEVSESTPERGGLPRRRFIVSPSGLASLRHVRQTLLQLWSGLEKALE